MRMQEGRREAAQRSAWRFFPLGVAGCMSIVIAVNIFMVTKALGTFPGKAGGDGFDLSNRYNQVIEQVQAQAALGWTLDAAADVSHRAVLTLVDDHGQPIAGAHVFGAAVRPLGDEDRTQLSFQETAPGRYTADAPLPLAGQWELRLTAMAQGHDYTATRRVFAR